MSYIKRILMQVKQIDNLFKNWSVCNRKEKIGKSCEYVMITKPEDRISVEILEITLKNRVVLAIDYLDKIWA